MYVIMAPAASVFVLYSFRKSKKDNWVVKNLVSNDKSMVVGGLQAWSLYIGEISCKLYPRILVSDFYPRVYSMQYWVETVSMSDAIVSPVLIAHLELEHIIQKNLYHNESATTFIYIQKSNIFTAMSSDCLRCYF